MTLSIVDHETVEHETVEHGTVDRGIVDQDIVDQDLSDLKACIDSAPAASPGLMAELVARACPRLCSPNHAAAVERIRRLVALNAWTEVALAIVDVELPRWSLRRIIHEDGAWHCRLTRQRKLPDWLADGVEARHECLALAILSAVVEARRCGELEAQHPASSVPRCPVASPAGAGSATILCCDNFA